MHGMRDLDEVAKKRVGTHSAMLLFIVAHIIQDSPSTIKRRKKEQGIRSESKRCFKLCRISRIIPSVFVLFIKENCNASRVTGMLLRDFGMSSRNGLIICQ